MLGVEWMHLCTLLLGYTDHQKTPISGYCLILTLLESILVQVARYL